MPGAYWLSKYVDEKDKFGEKVGDWAQQVSQGLAKCKVCESYIKFHKGKLELIRHSETKKHQEAKTRIKNKKHQRNLFDFIENSDANRIKCQARDLEIAIVALLSNHQVPPTLAECLITILKKHITDSEILKHVKLSHEKSRYMTVYGLGQHFEAETVKKLKNCDGFSISIDESEVNHRSELEIQATVASDVDGVEYLHYKVVDLESGDAETIKESVFDAFNDDSIDHKSKLINVGMDGCSTMQGNKGGVITKMKEEVDQLRSDGSCNAHNVTNVMQHATTVFDKDIKNALVDTHQDLGGARGRGLKKQKEFKKVCRDQLGFEPQPILQFIPTRFRSLRMCIKPVLYNYLGLVKYYSSLKKPTERQAKLMKFYVERCDITRIKLKFIFAANSDFNDAVDYFEKRGAHIHNTSSKLEDILVTQYRKVFDETVYNKLDEDDNLKLKTRRELLDIDVDKAKTLKNAEMFVGSEVSKEIKALGLHPDSIQLKWLYDDIKKFHLEACKKLQKYFRTVLSSTVMDNMSALDPKLQSHFATKEKLKSLASQYSKIVDSIQFVDGKDMIRKEIEKYATD